MKNVLSVQQGGAKHWVGDGFPVQTVFSHHSHGQRISPFLLLDYAGPANFPPSNKPRGVEEHPHRGFETVTIVYSGEVEHRDSAGGGGIIRAGDVQWMTAAAGMVHEEMHSRAFTQTGGAFEVIQLWVNLPAKDKTARPHYQAVTAQQIPQVSLPESAGTLRVIAGEYNGVRGPANTYTPLNVWDVRLSAGRRASFPVPDGHNTLLFLLSGELKLGDGRALTRAGLAVFDPRGDAIEVEASGDSKLLILDGEPIDEPVVAHGPFVMNSVAEIQQALDDYRSGRMGQLGS
jgi:redox-sensitive bicupin YhaK (pirin superfamily)